MTERGWSIRQDGYSPDEVAYFDALFTLSNGHIAATPTVDFEDARANPFCFVAGLFDQSIGPKNEIANLPHWVPVAAYVDGVPVGPCNGRLLAFERTLDMRSATVRTDFTVEDACGRVTSIWTETLVHATELRLGLVRGGVTAHNHEGRIQIRSAIDHRFGNRYLSAYVPAIANQCTTRHGDLVTETDFRHGIVVAYRLHGGAVVAVGSSLEVSSPVSRRLIRDRHRFAEVADVAVAAGVETTFTKVAAVHVDDDDDATDDAITEVTRLRGRFDQLVAAHRREWSRRWESLELRIDGDPELEEGMRFGLFHCVQALPAKPLGVGSTGLTSDYLGGHYFTNSELYDILVHCQWNPERAKRVAEYRHRSLDAARRAAMEGGNTGARYPEEADASGREASVTLVRDPIADETYTETTGELVKHTSAEVAYGIYQYVSITGDREFLWDTGLEIVVETARFAADLCVWSDATQHFDVPGVMGPDEYHYPVNNSFAVNYLLRWNLRYACSLVEECSLADAKRAAELFDRLRVTEEETERWRHIAELIALPRQDRDGVYEQFAGYWDLPEKTVALTAESGWPQLDGEDAGMTDRLLPLPNQLIKQCDVLLIMALFPDDFTTDVVAANFAFYEPRTLHGSSLSAGPHAFLALRCGQPAYARRMMKRAARYNLDFYPRRDYVNGVHLGAYSSAWRALVEGCAGLRWDGRTIRFEPTGLAGITVRTRRRLRGHEFRVTTALDRAELELLTDEPVRGRSGDMSFELSAERRSLTLNL